MRDLLAGIQCDRRCFHEHNAVLDTTTLCVAISEAVVSPFHKGVIESSKDTSNPCSRCACQLQELENPREEVNRLILSEHKKLHVNERTLYSFEWLVNFLGGERERGRWQVLRATRLNVVDVESDKSRRKDDYVSSSSSSSALASCMNEAIRCG